MPSRSFNGVLVEIGMPLDEGRPARSGRPTMSGREQVLERCRALPAAESSYPFGADTAVFKVREDFRAGPPRARRVLRPPDGWVLAAWCQRNDARLFRLDRLHTASATNQACQPRDLDTVLGRLPAPTVTPA